MRYKNWKIYYTMVPSDPAGAYSGPRSTAGPRSRTSGAIPSSRTSGEDQKSLGTSIGGTLAAPSTAYIYNWNMLPVGQQLWLKELESYREFPPLQAPESYNLVQVCKQVRTQGNQATLVNSRGERLQGENADLR